MGKDRLEEYIKDQIHDHRSEVNPDAIWAAIQQPEQKKRKPFWLLGLFGVLLVTAIIGYQFLGDSNNESAKNRITQTEKLANENNKENTNSSNDSHPIKIQETLPVTKDKVLIDHTNLNPETNSITKENTSASDIDNNDASEPAQQIKPITYNTSPDRSPEQSISGSNITHSAEANKKSQTDAIVSKEMMVTSDPILRPQSTINKGNGQAKIQSEKQAPLTPFFLNSLDAQSMKLDFNRTIAPDLLAIPKMERPIDPLQDQKAKAWNLSVHYGYLKGARELSADTLDTQELAIRNTYEEFMEAWELGARIGYTHRSGLRLETGLTYSQINDRSIVPRVEEKFLYPKPDFYGRTIIKEITTVNQHRFHKIRMIDLPVHLSYGLNKGKWSIRPGAGINLNLITRGGGNITGIDDDGHAGLLDVSTINNLRTNIGYNLEAKLELSYVISDELSLNLSTNYKHYPNSFTLSGISQHYKMWGLRLGLSRSF